jgi:hypothetical protein
MTSLNLDRDRLVEADHHRRRRDRDEEEPVTKLLDVANVVYKLGLPTVLVIYLVYFVTSGLAKDVKGMGEDHKAMRVDSAVMREDHRLIGRYLRAICQKLPLRPGQADPCYQVSGPID